MLRLWLRGEGLRSIGRMSSVERKTVRRYVAAAVDARLERSGGEEQLDDGLLAQVCEVVRPHRPSGHGAAWSVLVANHDELKAWVGPKASLLSRPMSCWVAWGSSCLSAPLHRYALEVLGAGRSVRTTTVRVAVGSRAAICRADFAKLGLVPDPEAGRSRVCQALSITACYSRHCFVWLTFTQTTAAVLDGFEAAWAFFGGSVGHRCQEASSARRPRSW